MTLKNQQPTGFALGPLPAVLAHDDSGWGTAPASAAMVPEADHLQPRLTRALWTAPVVLQFPGHSQTFDAKTVNISTTGIGIYGPAGLAVGDQLQINCPLVPNQHPVPLAAVVVWGKAAGSKTSYYGLSFYALAAPAQIALKRLLCTLQIAPKRPLSERQLRPSSRSQQWWYLLAGVLIGAVVGQLPWRRLLLRSQQFVAPAPTLASVAAVPPKAPEPLLTPPPLSSPPTAAAVAAAVIAKNNALKVEEASHHITLTLPTNGPITTYQSLWLHRPERLVVDIPYRQSTLDGTLFEVSHALVQRVRVGKHLHKARFVLELGKAMRRNVAFEKKGQNLKVQLFASEQS